MMWSRTSTVNKLAPLRVGNGLAEHATLRIENFWKSLGQIREIDRWREQRIEPLVLQQRNCSGEAAAMRPPCPVRRSDLSDLAGDQSQPAAVEGASKHRVHRRITIPTHFEHCCLFASQL